MKYILMQAPIKSADYSSKIVIIDNSSIIGKHKVENLINEDFKYVGIIESDLRINQLKSGFEFNCCKKINEDMELILDIQKLINNWF